MVGQQVISTCKRINLWSSPRNISTALMYSFAQRTDARVVDEPLYAHYLLHQTTEADHPGREEILAAQENDGELVVRRLLHHDYGRPAVIFKQMTHHLTQLDTAFLGEMTNVLLIRDPRAILASFSKVVQAVTANDIGIPQQHELFRMLKANGTPPVIVDARRLLLQPKRVLQQLCEHLNLPWEEKMLQWPAGARPEDGVWASHWYTNVHRSTGFQPYVEKEITLSPYLEDIAKECLPLYQELLNAAL